MLKCWITTHRGRSGYQLLSGRTQEVIVPEFHSSPGNSVQPSFGAVTFYLFKSHIKNIWLEVLLQRLRVSVKAWFLQSNIPQAFYPLPAPFNPIMMPILQLRKLSHKHISGSSWTETKVGLIPEPEPLTSILQTTPPSCHPLPSSCFNLHTRCFSWGFASAVTSTATDAPSVYLHPLDLPKL